MGRSLVRQATLTRRMCEELRPLARRYRVRDTKVGGLALVVEPHGRKWWTVRFVTASGKNTEKALGEWPGLLPEAARDAAAAVRLRVRQTGADPAAEKRAARRAAVVASEETVAGLAAAYFEAVGAGYGARGRPKAQSTIAKETASWRTHLSEAFGRKHFRMLRRLEVIERLDAIAAERGPGAANSALEVLRQIYGFALDRELVDASPVDRVKPRVLAARDRVATAQEMGVIWRRLCEEVEEGERRPNTSVGRSHLQLTGAIKARSSGVCSARALQLAILTLQRRGEVCAIHARDVDWQDQVWTIPALNKKERRLGKTPLSPQASAVLRAAFKASQCEWAFPNPDRSGPLDPHVLTRRFERLIETLGLPRLSVHDMRRTGRTMLTSERVGVDELTAERVLNHVVGTTQQRAYDWNAYLGAKRQALERWALEIERMEQRA